jgi:uracil-DNA glycosylase family 4
MRPSEDCDRCSLCRGRTNVVMPDGDPDAAIAFIGEAPGAKEDEAGRPFVGSSGRVLNILLEAEGLSRNEVFITNTVKCRPPNNRPPTQEEMDACLPCLESELEGRKVIVTLGRSAARDLLKRDIVMKDEVNQPLKVTIKGKEIILIPAYHPAASYYNPKVRDSIREAIRTARTYL